MPGTDQYLAGLKVLIVEDEPFIALDLAYGVEEAGGIPLGPASSIAQALRLIENELPDAAIVDVDLPDGKIGPVLAVLLPGVPVVVHTGVGLPESLREAHPELLVCTKPTAPSELARRLSAEISRPL
ncbi:response regulator [Puniceibacterium confluentis]|uniref:response regulator n=1 Tax=Puniceibacterium confluentis TaxID=1958944 RepID=UPI0035643314